MNLELSKGLLSETENVGLASWPIDIEQADNYGFIGECVYKKG